MNLLQKFGRQAGFRWMSQSAELLVTDFADGRGPTDVECHTVLAAAIGYSEE
jgi:hypothetical protein